MLLLDEFYCSKTRIWPCKYIVVLVVKVCYHCKKMFFKSWKDLQYVCGSHIYSAMSAAMMNQVAQTISTLASSCMHMFMSMYSGLPLLSDHPRKKHPRIKAAYRTTKNCAQLLCYFRFKTAPGISFKYQVLVVWAPSQFKAPTVQRLYMYMVVKYRYDLLSG